jgi:hypothetical protein
MQPREKTGLTGTADRSHPWLFFFVLLCLVVLVIIGCGGGGGDGELPPPPTTGTISGNLIVPPNQIVETEPNDSISQAQTIMSTSTVTGHAAIGDPFFPLPGIPIGV